MSAKELELLERLRCRYAKHFGVPLKEVKTREYSDDLVCFCPGRPELPEWSVGGNS